MTRDLYTQYFAAEATVNGRKRHAALVALTADSEKGFIKYTVSASFFPHDTEDDFAVSYDAFFSKEVFLGKGRRSQKREADLLKSLRQEADSLAKEAGAQIFWEKPLKEAKVN